MITVTYSPALNEVLRHGRFMNIALPNEDTRVHTVLYIMAPIGRRNEWCELIFAGQWRQVLLVKEWVSRVLVTMGGMFM